MAVRSGLSRAGRSRPALDRADTITLDPHKWFFQGYDIGGLLVRRRDDLLQTFHRSPEYYRTTRPQDEPLHWYQYSLEGTRRFRALKLWLSWKSRGTEGFGRLIESTLAVAAHLAARCRRADDFEAEPSEPELSVVCSATCRVAPSPQPTSIPPSSIATRTDSSARWRSRRGLGLDDAPARLDLAACRDRQLPRDRGRRRRPAGLPAPPGGRSSRARRRASDRRPVSGEDVP
jgi:hypothetical protein